MTWEKPPIRDLFQETDKVTGIKRITAVWQRWLVRVLYKAISEDPTWFMPLSTGVSEKRIAELENLVLSISWTGIDDLMRRIENLEKAIYGNP